MGESTKHFGVSGVNSVAAKSNTIEVNGDHFFKRKKKKQQKKCLHPVVASKCLWAQTFKFDPMASFCTMFLV